VTPPEVSDTSTVCEANRRRIEDHPPLGQHLAYDREHEQQREHAEPEHGQAIPTEVTDRLL
jgi:hypothetical protein